ncbi:unnamed protein product [Rotaria socialis]|uniref:Serpin domain-containing protein n=1 Tax=Rotaria socialis TaxID=392032 RepID=A0A820LCQ8_9BILA|nr:unnamed protein product [Rotaria socialis]CAF4320509.1 unnamed protein product [Rotaria socialis]CAF4357211.1 unnamed protein product [Rotaria socialis]CAF4626387.1 unnamed protein product [Rotaria socialis]
MLLETFLPMPRLILVIALLLSNVESKLTAVSKKSIEDFHLNLYKSIVATKPDDNIFFSPYSISLALAMITGGAQGKTEKELLHLLQIPSRNQLDALVKQLMSITRLPEIKLANRLYPDKKFQILPAFKRRLEKLHNITLVSVDLNAKNVTPVINGINTWVSNQTGGYIKKALDKKDLVGNTSPAVNALLIINCLLFDATWQVEFQGQNTLDGNTFYPDIGPPLEKKLTLMRKMDLTFTIILPNKNIKLSQVESNLTPALLNSPTTTNQNIFLSIPKWKFEFESQLENILKTKMKLNDIFDQNKANVKGLSMEKNIFLSNLIHKTYIIVDEKGVRAAATSIARIMLTTSTRPDVNFLCNKPFIYAIRYKQTTLFMGRYVKVIDTSNMPPIMDDKRG